MLKTRTDHWAMAMLGSLGWLSGCGAQSSSDDSEQASDTFDANGNTDAPPNDNPDTDGTADTGPEGSGEPDAVEPTNFELSACINPEPILAGEVNTGLVRCADGVIHRPAPVECPNNLAPPEETATPTCGPCMDDDYGFCKPQIPVGEICEYGCTTDADCEAGELCECGRDIGWCRPAACRTGDDCDGDSVCAQYYHYTGIGCDDPPGYACRTAQDQCRFDEDCPETMSNCSIQDGTRACRAVPGIACGRPFIVAGEPRVARLQDEGNWLAPLAKQPALERLTEPQRQALARVWAQFGLMEHASVAAFARFTLQLLQLGAPSGLIAASQHATLDETRHAALCFALASAYAGRTFGPGPLDMEHALQASTLQQVTRLVVREGCVGETLAALEAAEASAHCTDPGVQAIVAGISQDERRHSELAWRFVGWAVQRDPRLAQVVREECERAVDELDGTSDEAEPTFDTLPFGVLTPSLRHQLRKAAMADVVMPCLDVVLRRGSGEPATNPRHKLDA